jgi:hypothetical protein
LSSEPRLQEFRRQLEELVARGPVKRVASRGTVRLADLTLDEVTSVIREDVGYYFLLAAANLNRTSLKAVMRAEASQIVTPRKRRAFAIHSQLPVQTSLPGVIERAVALRAADLGRASRGSVEALFRQRLEDEGIPVLMSPPLRRVPGILVSGRKPDGVYPDPATHAPPRVYLEIKNIRRVSDDIQKRLYELAEASFEMKYLYGDLRVDGLSLVSTEDVAGSAELRAGLRAAMTATKPVVVGLFLCARDEGERYRAGAEAFVDRLFFQEEIEECLQFLRDATKD